MRKGNRQVKDKKRGEEEAEKKEKRTGIENFLKV